MTNTTLTIRRAAAPDSFAVRRLAALDSASPPTGEVLLAEIGNELWAAVSSGLGRRDRGPVPPERRPRRAAALPR